MLLKDKLASGRGEILSQYQFQELVEADEIAHAVIIYDSQSPALNEIVGTYYRKTDDRKVEVPFRTKIRFTGNFEEKLLRSPAFEAHQPNTMLWSLVWSVIPVVVIALFVWFFFLRHIRKVAIKTQPNTINLDAKTAEQQQRFDRVLEKWEQQAARMDALLDRQERKG
jgi:hypothetical protein